MGTKTEGIKKFLSATMKVTNFEDAKVSTLIETFKSVLLVAASLVKKLLLRIMVSTAQSIYLVLNTILFATRVSLGRMITIIKVSFFFLRWHLINAQDILGETFKFTLKQVTEMDKVNDVDGRKAFMYQTQLTCLAIHLGFGDLASPDMTLASRKNYQDKTAQAHHC